MAPDRPKSTLHRAGRNAALGITFLFVLATLVVSSALVVYTAWIGNLEHGAFAVLFATMSAQITLNWFRWKDEQTTTK